MTVLRTLLLTGMLLGLAALGGPIPANAGETADAVGEEPEWRFERGRHYQVLSSARPRSTSDPIEVVEFFWYGCPACFNFEPMVTDWKETLPDDVSVVRVPVIWGSDHERYARVFYTLKALGRIDELHREIFRDYHVRERIMRRDRDVENFYERFDIAPEDVRRAQFAVNSNISNARRLTSPAGYNISSTPTVVVNGRYQVGGDAVRTLDDVLQVTRELVEKERYQRRSGTGG